MRPNSKIAVAAISILLLGFATSCQKRRPVSALPVLPKAEVPESPKPNAPTILRFGLEPDSIERGQSATLAWEVRDADRIEIDRGIGLVHATGDRRVSPIESTNYTLRARGPGGDATAMTALNIKVPPPSAPVVAIPTPTISERIAREVQDAYFDFDQSTLLEDAREALIKDGIALKVILQDFPTATVIVEGHCDERGSAEYNLALGDRRATVAKALLSDMGVPAHRLLAISYGKERPQCMESNENCWQLNRRVHSVAGEDQERREISQLDE